MRPTLLPTLFALPSLALTPPLILPNAADIVDVLDSLSTQCEALMGPANQLSITNAPLLILGQGPWATVIDGFAELVTTLTAGTAALPPSGTQFTSAEEAAITDEFQAFGTEAGELFDALTTTGNAVSNVPVVGLAMSQAIGSLQNAFEGFGSGIRDLVDRTGAEQVGGVVGDLQKQIEGALDAFIGN